MQMSDAIHTIIVDLRGKEMEMKIENPVRRVTVKDRKENMMDTRENNENSEN